MLKNYTSKVPSKHRLGTADGRDMLLTGKGRDEPCCGQSTQDMIWNINSQKKHFVHFNYMYVCMKNILITLILMPHDLRFSLRRKIKIITLRVIL